MRIDCGSRTADMKGTADCGLRTHTLGVPSVAPVPRIALHRRPERPFVRSPAVFIGAGRADTMVPQSQVVRLAEILREAGAEVTLHWEPGGHEVSPGVVAAAQQWLAQHVVATGAASGATDLWAATRQAP